MSSLTASRGGTVRAFEGLRAVAILIVIFHHLLPDDVLGGGVEAFFVLSGYLITTILIREYTKTGAIRFGRFLYRRLLRLYPGLITTVLLVSIGLVIIGEFRFAVEQAAVASTYLFDLYLPITGRPIGALGHTWSLGLEQQFYLTWPFVVFALMRYVRRPGARLGVAAGLAVVTFALQLSMGSNDHNFSPPARMAALAFGCALGFLLAQRRIVLHRVALWLATAAYVAMTVLVDVTHTLSHAWVRPVAELSALAVVWVLATAGDHRVGLLTNRVAVHLGSISYGLFLWHFPIFYFFFHADAPLWLTAAVGLPLTLGLAELSRYLVELPFLRFKDRPIPQLRFRRNAVVPDPNRMTDPEPTAVATRT